VECISSYKYPQEPKAFSVGDNRYEVEEVEGAFLTPEGPLFRVRACGRRFSLLYWEESDEWLVKEI